MSIANMNPIDLNLKLLRGNTLYVGNIPIKPLTLAEIDDFGYLNYMQLMGVVTVKAADLISKTDKELAEKIKDKSAFELILVSEDENLINMFLEGLQLFLRRKIISVSEEVGIIFGDEDSSFEDQFWVNRDNLNDIVEVIRHQNYLKSGSSEQTHNPKDDKAKRVIDNLKKYQAIVDKKKAADQDSDQIDFSDIVSAVSAKSNALNKFTIWDATIFQIYDEYKRLEMISGYEVGVSAALQGAKIDLKHWSSRMN